MDNIHWREPDEKPTGDFNGIYFLTYKDEHWDLHSAAYYNYDFVNPATEEVEHREYLEEPVLDMEMVYSWKEVKKWCYFEEFEEILKSTF